MTTQEHQEALSYVTGFPGMAPRGEPICGMVPLELDCGLLDILKVGLGLPILLFPSPK